MNLSAPSTSTTPYTTTVDKLSAFSFENIINYLTQLFISRNPESSWSFTENYTNLLNDALRNVENISGYLENVYTLIFCEITICDCYTKEGLDEIKIQNNFTDDMMIKNINTPIFLGQTPLKVLLSPYHKYRQDLFKIGRKINPNMPTNEIIDTFNQFIRVLNDRPNYVPTDKVTDMKKIYTPFSISIDDIQIFNTQNLDEYKDTVLKCSEGQYYKKLQLYDMAKIKDYYLTFYDVSLQKLFTDFQSFKSIEDIRNFIDKVCKLLFFDIRLRDCQSKLLYNRGGVDKEHLMWRDTFYNKALNLYIVSLSTDKNYIFGYINTLFEDSIRNINNKHRYPELYSALIKLSTPDFINTLSQIII